jgi:hypothetical protein
LLFANMIHPLGLLPFVPECNDGIGPPWA